MGFSLFLGSAALPNHNTAVPSPLAISVPATPSYAVTLTAYNAVEDQTDSNPFETASGAYSNPEVIAARSQNLAEKLPFGTIIEIDGSNASQESCGFSAVKHLIGYRVIEDSMNVRYTDRIDVLFDTSSNLTRSNGTTVNAANILGICKDVTFRVVGYVDAKHIPKTQIELADLVGKGNGLALK
jgi:3D (Asp-Asp-Asp) domain-containing protein